KKGVKKSGGKKTAAADEPSSTQTTSAKTEAKTETKSGKKSDKKKLSKGGRGTEIAEEFE
ncbi:MAG: hypothetical protein JRF63_02135, partial [Deltaproteobacteria bacterium]|nr:hypothetical protein [Deltaproteobacteria bacterium]